MPYFINDDGRRERAPEGVNPRTVRQLLNYSPNEVPVLVRQDGKYEALPENSEYFANDDVTLDKVNIQRLG